MCWICKRSTQRLRKQFSPQAGKRRCAALHSVCRPVAVSTFVVKFGNSNCRWSAAFWFTHAATNIRFGSMIAHGSLLVMIGTRHWNCIMTDRCGITPVPAMGGVKIGLSLGVKFRLSFPPRRSRKAMTIKITIKRDRDIIKQHRA